MSWLDPTRWLLYGGLVLALILGVGRLDESRQQIGYDRAQAEDTAAALKASEAARVKETALNISNERLKNDLVKKSREHADAVAAADDAERVFLSVLNSSPSGTGSTATARIDAAGGPERELLGACAQNLVGLAKEADRLENKVLGLQTYVTTVCRPP